MPNCARCEALPSPLPETGTLYIAAPIAHSGGSVRSILARAGLEPSEPTPGVLAVEIGPGILDLVAEAFTKSLGPLERADARSLLLPEGTVPSLGDLMRMQPLSTLIARVRGRWLHALIRDDQLITHFQPIVHAEDTGAIFAHECLLRGIAPDGSLIPPGQLYGAAREADLMFPLDRAARLRAIRSAVEIGSTGRFFINFNPTSIYDPAFCLRTTIAAIEQAGIEPSRMVFEVVESDESHPDLPKIFRYYREAGFRVALDDLGAGFGSLNLMTELKPDFVKFDIQLVRGVDLDPYKADVLAKLIEMARSLGVGTVAEGIETEGEADWVRDHGIDYLQGFLIARPGNPPAAPRRLAPVDCLSA